MSNKVVSYRGRFVEIEVALKIFNLGLLIVVPTSTVENGLCLNSGRGYLVKLTPQEVKEKSICLHGQAFDSISGYGVHIYDSNRKILVFII